ncbi:MAG: signal peptidase II [Pseudomonadota bacterium]|nr:signal peptidase II [Pseudomonadota bacterium]
MSVPALPRREAGVSRLGLGAYALAAAVLVLDQLSKLWVLEGLKLEERGSIEVLPILSLSMVWNRGVSFGLLQAQQDLARWGLAAFSAAVAVALVLWARRVQRPLLATALGLIIGGAVGNLIDRVRFGAVADFIDVSGLGFFPWVFNVADSAITIGVLLLVLDSLTPAKRTAAMAPQSGID